MHRPELVVLVVGTDTDVGKTWVSARLLASLRGRGRSVAALKPVQSFVAGDETDADLLAAAAGQQPHDVCPAHRWYEVPMAPPMAAEILGLPAPLLGDLVGELVWPPGVDVGVVETVGGVRSPLAGDADATDLAAALDPDTVLLVADAGLGTINQVRLAVAALDDPVVVMLNRFDDGDPLHLRNRVWLSENDELDVVVAVDELVERWS